MAGYSKTIPLPGKTADIIYTAISNDIDRFLTKSSLGSYELNREESKKQVSFKSKMASGTLAAKEGSLQVDISLSFLALPFKSKIDEGIQKWLNKTFG